MILDEIIQKRHKAVEQLKEHYTTQQFMQEIEKQKWPSYNFMEALKQTQMGPSIIAEVKKASPSKGVICQNFEPVSIAKNYQEGGASAISVLTEPHYFQGENSYLTRIKENVSLPLLRKDFIIDGLQIYEAKAIGADAILLIVAALKPHELRSYLQLAARLSLDCLVETHDEEEIKQALEAEAQIIGVNNRNLQTFEVSLEVCERLRHLVPKDRVFVAESGIHTKEDVRRLKALDVDALLIGESVMKAENPADKLRELREL